MRLILSGMFVLWLCPPLPAQTPHPSKMEHTVVFHQPDLFAAWPANGGLWTWNQGREILVAFATGKFKEQPGHNILKPYAIRFARSLDGGQTWMMEAAESFPAEGAKLKDLPEKLDFSAPDLVLRLIGEGYHGCKEPLGGLVVSKDRGKTWNGPYRLRGLSAAPELKDWEITCRTDYIIQSASEGLFFGSARQPKKSGTDRTFAMRTKDGASTWEFVGWIVSPTDPNRGVMPSTLRLSKTNLVSAVRRREPTRENNWVDLYASEDEGKTWKHVSKIGETGTGNGNPPALIQLQDGRLCCAYGNRTTRKMLARLSKDQGQTWGDEIILRDDYKPDSFDNADFGYPRMLQRKDGTIITLYYWSDANHKEAYIAQTAWKAD